MYGQRHPLETPELINDSLELLVEELWKLPDEDQSGTQKASIRCPDIIESKEHRLMFLRCEQFNVDVSGFESFSHVIRAKMLIPFAICVVDIVSRLKIEINQ